MDFCDTFGLEIHYPPIRPSHLLPPDLLPSAQRQRRRFFLVSCMPPPLLCYVNHPTGLPHYFCEMTPVPPLLLPCSCMSVRLLRFAMRDIAALACLSATHIHPLMTFSFSFRCWPSRRYVHVYDLRSLFISRLASATPRSTCIYHNSWFMVPIHGNCPSPLPHCSLASIL